MLEAGGVGRVTRDRHVNILVPQDSHTFANIVSAIALNLQAAGVVAIRNLLDNLQLRGEVVELSLYVCETIDAADDLCSVLAQTVQDNAEGLLTNLVGHLGNLDGTLGSSERLVTSQEGEALSLLAEQTGSQVTMTQTHLTVVGNRTGDTEALQTDTDSLGSVSGSLHTLLDSDSGTTNVCPLSVLEANALCVLTHLIGVNTSFFTNLVGFLNTIDAILFQSSKNLVDTALLTLKLYFSNHSLLRSASVRASKLLHSLVGIHTVLDGFHHLAQVYILVTANLVVGIEEHLGDVTLGEFEIASTLGNGAIERTSLRTETLTEVFQTSADSQTALRESTLCATIDNLQEQFAHSGVDSVAYQVGIQGFQQCLARQDFTCHSSRVGHTRATDGLNQCFLDDTVLHVEAQFAGTLLRSAPTDTVGVTRNVLNLLCLNPFALLGNGCRSMIGALADAAHVLHFCGINHCLYNLRLKIKIIYNFAKLLCKFQLSKCLFLYLRTINRGKRYFLCIFAPK